ncbi:MAG: 5,10-methylene tetrahydromethanopterin reductase, partial [Anaerolineae bacterium]|nr:5,10-methylene tetrahydromethanopterin reductase [Anaerolineae bacterium]
LESIDVAACIWVSIADDRAAAEDPLRAKIAYYGHAFSPLIWDALGVTQADFAPIARVVQHENDLERAKAMITPAMLRVGVAGTSHDLIERLEGLVALGMRHLSFGPPLGPDLFAAVAALGRDVIPHFRKAR